MATRTVVFAASLAAMVAVALVFGALGCTPAGVPSDEGTGTELSSTDGTAAETGDTAGTGDVADEATASDAATEADAAEEKPPPPPPVKPVNASQLWQLINEERYTRWQAAPGFEGFGPGTGPHDARIRIWVNDVAAATLAKSPRPRRFPPGSIIAKNGYNTSLTLRLIAVMRKQADGKWFFAEYRPGGRVLAAGVMTPGCANCHRAGQDYVRAFKLRP